MRGIRLIFGRRPSGAPGTIATTDRRSGRWTSPHFREIEKVLLYVSEARRKAATVADAIEREGGERHLVEALNAAEQGLAELHRTLMQGTYFAVPKQQLSM